MEFELTPIVTENAPKLTEKLNRYTFRVSPEAHKYEIQNMVEKLYGVHVVKVNTMIVRGKNRSRYTRTGIIKGATSDYKKAIITIADGETIDYYSNL